MTTDGLGYGPGVVPPSPPDYGGVPPAPDWSPDPDTLAYLVPRDERDRFVKRAAGMSVPGTIDLPATHPDDPGKFATSFRVSPAPADRDGREMARVDVTFRRWDDIVGVAARGR